MIINPLLTGMILQVSVSNTLLDFSPSDEARGSRLVHIFVDGGFCTKTLPPDGKSLGV